MPLSQGLLSLLNTTEEFLTIQLMLDVKNIFNRMVGLEGTMYFPVQIDPVTNFENSISALVGLTGTYSGVVGLHMPCSVAIRVTSRMLETDITELDDTVNDAMGEIANMIAGSFKQHLSTRDLDIHHSIPSVVSGKKYSITTGHNPDQIAVRFATDDAWFIVAVAFEEY